MAAPAVLSPIPSAVPVLDHPKGGGNDSATSQLHEEPQPLPTGELGALLGDLAVEEKQNQDSGIIHAREYQLEMFEESLKRNIIVAMDTGTGKTQVAILRIQAELDKSPPPKIVWFLAPTVVLCEQQARVVRSQIPAAQVKTLVGSDGVETWSDVRMWDDYLRNVHVVVSTYQVLLDAINHAFVPMDRLSLIIFDEAHSCRGKHAGSKIMARYHNNKTAGLPIPAILGLTASPLVSSRVDSLEQIEQTLDAICRSPRIHRGELLSVVKQPVMSHIFYAQPDYIPMTSTMKSLAEAFHGLDIYEDPKIIRLQKNSNSERSRVALDRALKNRDTYVFNQMQSFWRKSATIQRELGTWAVDYFIYTSVTQFLRSVNEDNSWYTGWETAEKQYLARALENVKISIPPSLGDGVARIEFSDKVAALIQELSSSADDTIGIVFVREIATVAVLSDMLSLHPLIKNRFRIGTMIGTSNHLSQKRDLGAPNKMDYPQNLDDFQRGKLNLLIATSVLEEGIDVRACNMVVCFDPPDNLKTFIQRRGRARKGQSRLVLLMDKPTSQVEEWMQLEEEMKRRYEEDMRCLMIEELEQPEVAPFHIPGTGACLDFDQSKSHLEHLCRKLSIQQYTNSQPYYIFKETPTPQGKYPIISATVVLPISLPSELRRAESTGLWLSEKSASKDAAFQAYISIYKAGLVNDNLMPLTNEFISTVDMRASTVKVHKTLNPWARVARAWSRATKIYQRRLRLIDQHGEVLCEFDASLPVPFPALPDIDIFWNRSNHWRIEVGQTKIIDREDLAADQTSALLDLAYRHRKVEVKDDVQAVLHIRSPTQDIPLRQLLGQKGIEKASLDGTALIRFNEMEPFALIERLPFRDPAMPVYDGFLQEPTDAPWLKVRKWPRRRDFLHYHVDERGNSSSAPGKSTITYLPEHRCREDGIQVSNVYFGSLIPSITHLVEIYMVASELCNTILKDLEFEDLSLVVTAISASSARETTDYQRLEFLGDSVLKLLATATVAANNPTFTEGYLDAMKTALVCNSRLCRSALETGLDRFILITPFTGAKWQPLYVQDLETELEDESGEYELSTKILADVVEALIGASFLHGGIDKALSCVQIFVPEIKWQSLGSVPIEWRTLDSASSKLFSQTEMSKDLPNTLVPLEELIGHSFRNKNLLVEAATHASFSVVDTATSCMERLEFIGDAVLDSIIVSVVWEARPEMTHAEMHLYRTASVNADLLGFLGMEWTASREVTEISEDKTIVTTQTKVPFWKFMRHTSQEISNGQQEAEDRCARERDVILDAIKHGSEYPWPQLTHLRIPKYFSDFFESVVGAVWVDSGGSMAACTAVVERVGILPYLRRLLEDRVDVVHPKNRLGEICSAVGLSVQYQIEVREGPGGAKELACKVRIGEEFIVEVDGGLSHDDIETKAADTAYRMLLPRLEEMKKKRRCGDVGIDVDVDVAEDRGEDENEGPSEDEDEGEDEGVKGNDRDEAMAK